MQCKSYHLVYWTQHNMELVSKSILRVAGGEGFQFSCWLWTLIIELKLWKVLLWLQKICKCSSIAQLKSTLPSSLSSLQGQSNGQGNIFTCYDKQLGIKGEERLLYYQGVSNPNSTEIWDWKLCSYCICISSFWI